MFVGHGLIAFALVAASAAALGIPRDRALLLGGVAALFATVPDTDIVYAPAALLIQSAGTLGPDTFWTTADVVHRGPTHSIPFGIALAGAAALWVTGQATGRAASLTIAAALIVVSTTVTGLVTGAVITVYVGAGLAIAAAANRFDLSPRSVFAAGVVAFATHPFGDLVTGGPPAAFYPFDVALVSSRVVLHSDPTVHLLAAFLLELGAVWAALWTYARLRGVSLMPRIQPRASLGTGFPIVFPFIPAPTVSHSAPFVFSALAVGIVGVGIPTKSIVRRQNRFEVAVTGVAVVTIAVVAYGVAYLLA